MNFKERKNEFQMNGFRFIASTKTFYQVIRFVVCREVVELDDVEKIILDDVTGFQAAGLQGQVVVVRCHQSDRTENRFDFGSERN